MNTIGEIKAIKLLSLAFSFSPSPICKLENELHDNYVYVKN